jgi:hypothetical protein
MRWLDIVFLAAAVTGILRAGDPLQFEVNQSDTSTHVGLPERPASPSVALNALSGVYPQSSPNTEEGLVGIQKLLQANQAEFADFLKRVEEDYRNKALEHVLPLYKYVEFRRDANEGDIAFQSGDYKKALSLWGTAIADIWPPVGEPKDWLDRAAYLWEGAELLSTRMQLASSYVRAKTAIDSLKARQPAANGGTGAPAVIGTTGGQSNPSVPVQIPASLSNALQGGVSPPTPPAGSPGQAIGRSPETTYPNGEQPFGPPAPPPPVSAPGDTPVTAANQQPFGPPAPPPPVSAPGDTPVTAANQQPFGPSAPPPSVSAPGDTPVTAANQQPFGPSAPPPSVSAPGDTPVTAANQQPFGPSAPPPPVSAPGDTPVTAANQQPSGPSAPPPSVSAPGDTPVTAANQQPFGPPAPPLSAPVQPAGSSSFLIPTDPDQPPTIPVFPSHQGDDPSPDPPSIVNRAQNSSDGGDAFVKAVNQNTTAELGTDSPFLPDALLPSAATAGSAPISSQNTEAPPTSSTNPQQTDSGAARLTDQQIIDSARQASTGLATQQQKTTNELSALEQQNQVSLAASRDAVDQSVSRVQGGASNGTANLSGNPFPPSECTTKQLPRYCDVNNRVFVCGTTTYYPMPLLLGGCDNSKR